MNNKILRVAAIAIDENGVYHFNYLGDHIDQGGGIVFCYAGVGGSKAYMLKKLTEQLEKHEARYLEIIKKEQNDE